MIRIIISPFINIVFLYLITWFAFGDKAINHQLYMVIIGGFYLSYLNLANRLYINQDRFPFLKKFFSPYQEQTIEVEGLPKDVFILLKDQLIAKQWKLIKYDEKGLTMQFKERHRFAFFYNIVEVQITPLAGDNLIKVNVCSQPFYPVTGLLNYDGSSNLSNILKVEAIINSFKTNKQVSTGNLVV